MLMNNSDFEELYSKQFDSVYRYALTLTGRHSVAEEITQEAFTRLLNNGSYIKRIEQPAARWIHAGRGGFR
jgi:DNA-directed RNA polymerase specialized sigma24 family protein